ncbi:hypothetical protein [Brevundimonas sp. R86498]|uniref:hypothetical protein n=1 Tax=Brevundimonas sp. R86498 TaxID=3093845 RepID=UPI0037C6A77C
MRVDHLPNGQPDTNELEWFLNKAVGEAQWLMTTDWLFTDPPEVEEHGQTVPVLVPEVVAVRLLLSDLEGPVQRVVHDHPVVGIEGRRWRWAAFAAQSNDRGEGRFPWELAHG